MIIGLIIIVFSDVKSTEAIGTNLSFQQTVINIAYRNVNRLTEPSEIKINSNIEPKIIMLSLSNSIESVTLKQNLTYKIFNG